MMKLVLNSTQRLSIIGSPDFSKDPLKIRLDIESADEVELPAVGEIKVVDDIQWPGSKDKAEFELYTTDASNWKSVSVVADTSFCGVDADGKVIPNTGKVFYYFTLTNIDATESNAYIITDEEKEEERLRQLEAAKSEKITKSKTDLALYLDAHPLLWSDGEYYSVSSTKQAQLTSNLALYSIAQQAGQEFELKWNSTGDVCKVWDIADLSALALAIGSYVQPLVTYQQTQEVAVMNATTSEEVNAITIDYSTVWESGESK